ncbi:ABC transporter substrate-binding protein [Nocardioides marmotae]|uniref:ABC transporter substrate-binding protein n=1 Tax=Nocardioides marmotae TaxID=2663857 RepID=UPI0012B522F9|nr:ABC transporter substrate-binding protein [Nocardioides marmotae]MBC9734769.1 ABC transporter substrate-binding protein [Nocardioides marmotae]MTB85870.1 hypothetical protein [Nocardioides marmotae]
MNRRFFTRAGLVGVVLASSGLAAACGGDSAADDAAEGMTLTLGVPGPTTSAAAFVLAQEAGLFEKHGVDVTITDKGALAPSEVAAGKLDLAQYGTGAAFAPAESGRDMSIVYALLGNATGAIQVAADSPLEPQDSLEDTLMQLSGARVGVQGQGGSSYGNASAISKYVVDKGGEPLKLVPLPDYGAMTAQLVSGQLDATVVFANPFLEAIAHNKLRVLVPSTDPDLAALEGGDFAAISVFGVSQTLEKKHDAVVAFVKSVHEAYDLMDDTDLADLAEQLHENPLLSSLSVDNIEQQLELDKPFWRPNNGEITEESWQTALDAMSNWGLTQDLAKDAFSFDSIVDMNYYNEAQE